MALKSESESELLTGDTSKDIHSPGVIREMDKACSVYKLLHIKVGPSPFYSPALKKWLVYWFTSVRHSVRPSVRPSFRPSILP